MVGPLRQRTCRDVALRRPTAQHSSSELGTPSSPPSLVSHGARLVLLTVLSVFAANSEIYAQRGTKTPAGSVEYRVKSKYSNILIRKNGTVRTLVFVRDSGEEAMESQIDLNEPDDLRFEYLRSMYLSYGFVTQPRRVLIIGLGGGAMVHFFKKNDPAVHVDVVEIDETVVRLADTYFGVKPGPDGTSPRIVVDDGLAFIARVKEPKYDVIYLDAFLKPSAKTDATGVPLEQRTKQFYRSIQTALNPDGAAVFNINPHEKIQDDVSGIRGAFPQAYAFSLPHNAGKVVVASKVATRVPRSALLKNLAEADEKLQPNFSLRSRADWLDR
jgi:spermidine synthase